MSKFWFIAVAVLGACGSSTPAAPSTTTPTAPAATLCPMDLPGTSVTALDTSTGGALVFRTTGDLAALRARLDGWAERHNARHAAMGPLPTGAEAAAASGHDHHHHGDHAATPAAPLAADPALMIAAHTRAEVGEIDGGLRLTFVAFPEKLAAVQAEVRGHAEHLASAGCGAP
jgi:hypothetical protein